MRRYRSPLFIKFIQPENNNVSYLLNIINVRLSDVISFQINNQSMCHNDINSHNFYKIQLSDINKNEERKCRIMTSITILKNSFISTGINFRAKTVRANSYSREILLTTLLFFETWF